jgi:tetratricopeptide (TPR) repeat protein
VFFGSLQGFKIEVIAMTQKIFWGEGGQYGPFDVQSDGWPHGGQVMRFFREKMGLTAKAFGKLYGEEVNKDGRPICERWILEMELENKVPSDISRRRVIANLLKIPPILLGLASLEDLTLSASQGQSQPMPVKTRALKRVDIDILPYEKNIRIALRLHQTGNAHTLLRDVTADLRQLEVFKGQAKGDLLYQIGELLIGNYLLASKIERDRRNYEQAYNYANRAVLIAKHVEDEELLATAKHVRGVVKMAWGQFGALHQRIFRLDRGKIQDAMRDFQSILHMAQVRSNAIHPQLQGLTKIQLGRALGLLRLGQHGATAANALTLIDQASEAIDSEHIDDVYTRAVVIGDLSGLHLGGYLLHRANVLNALGLPGKALTELNKLHCLVESTYGKEETRMQSWRDIVLAETFLGLGEYQRATEKAKDALIACHAIHSIQNIANIVDIQGRLAASSSYGLSTDVLELGDMIREWYGEKYQDMV